MNTNELHNKIKEIAKDVNLKEEEVINAALDLLKSKIEISNEKTNN